MNGIPEWFCAFYTKNANLNFDLKPSPIYEQIFEQPQTKGEAVSYPSDHKYFNWNI